MTGRRREGTPRGFLTSIGMTLALMLLVAGGIADHGVLFSLVVLAGAGLAVGVLYLLFPQGPQFALSAADGLAMYACLYVVIGRAAFPDAADWARPVGFLLPVAGFLAACWLRRHGLRAWTERASGADLAHLPRVLRWMVAVGLIALVSLSLPVNRMGSDAQTTSLLVAMGAVAAVSAGSVEDVVRLLADIAAIFREVTHRLSRLAVPIAAYSSLWTLLVVAFGCLYRIADGLSRRPLFTGTGGPVRLDFSEAMHFSVVTLSTVGYGDIQPLDDGIRLLASIQMLLAQLLLLFGFYEIMRGSPAGVPSAERSAPRAPRPAPDIKEGDGKADALGETSKEAPAGAPGAPGKGHASAPIGGAG